MTNQIVAENTNKVNQPGHSSRITISAGKANAGEIQAAVNLQQLAKTFLGDGMPGGESISYLNPFDPDDTYGTLLIFKTYYRDVRTGDRGGAIKFIQRVRRCSYDNAIAFLVGWLLALEAVQS